MIYKSSAGMSTDLGHSCPAHEHTFIAYLSIPLQQPGATSAQVEEAFMLAARGVVVAGGPVG